VIITPLINTQLQLGVRGTAKIPTVLTVYQEDAACPCVALERHKIVWDACSVSALMQNPVSTVSSQNAGDLYFSP
jgi:hypothetical protein